MIHGAVRWKRCRRPTRDWIRGTNWIAEAPVPTTATRSPSRSWSWSHVAEWKVVPSKRSRPGRSGDRRRAERAGPEHEDPRGQLAAGGLDAPALRVLIPRRVEQLVAEAHVRHDPVVLRAAAQVVPNLGLRGEGARPLGVRGEGERVQVRGHVARAARIAVVAPRATDVVGLLQHDEVLDPGLAQADGHPQPGEA